MDMSGVLRLSEVAAGGLERTSFPQPTPPGTVPAKLVKCLEFRG
jgi:hypothetical protein